MNKKNLPNQNSSLTILNATKDRYIEYPKDTRLTPPDYHKKISYNDLPFVEELKNYLSSPDEQTFFDDLRNFKKIKFNEVKALETEPLKNREIILTKLSQIAHAIMIVAFEHVQNNMQEKYGRPSYTSSYQQIEPANLAVISMGKMGSGEINYESDLDLIFIFSHSGETLGKKSVSNAEFFGKFVQRFINLLSLQTIGGICFKIDTELRPSGNQGALVISSHHFINYQNTQAQNWERLALLRANANVGSQEFCHELNKHIDLLLFNEPLKPSFFTEMHGIRKQVIKEKAKETERNINIKHGMGGLMDLEFIIQGLQLKNGKIFKDLRERSLFAIFKKLQNHVFFKPEDLQNLYDAYTLYRTLEAKIHLLDGQSNSHLNFDSDKFKNIAQILDMQTTELEEKIIFYRSVVKNHYQQVYGLFDE